MKRASYGQLENAYVPIIGGGVAGPALAIALRRVGIEAVVYEVMPTPRDAAGAFLNLAPSRRLFVDSGVRRTTIFRMR